MAPKHIVSAATTTPEALEVGFFPIETALEMVTFV